MSGIPKRPPRRTPRLPKPRPANAKAAPRRRRRRPTMSRMPSSIRAPGPGAVVAAEIKAANPSAMEPPGPPPRPSRRDIRGPVSGRLSSSRGLGIVADIRDQEMFKAYAWARGFYHPDFPAQRYPDRNPAPTAMSAPHLWRLNVPYVAQAVTGTKYALFYIRPQVAGTVSFATAIAADGTITWGTAVNHPFLNLFTGEIDKYRIAKCIARVFDTSALLNRGGSLLKNQYVDAAAGQPVPTNISDIYSNQSNFFVDLAAKDLAEETSSAPILVDEAANDMVYLASATSQPVLFYAMRLPPDVADQDITFQIVMVLEFIPFGSYVFKYATAACTGDPNMVSTVLETYASRLDSATASSPSDWTWRGIAESVLNFGRRAWGPVRAVANVLAPVSSTAGMVASGMNALSGDLAQRHHMALAAFHARFEAYKALGPRSSEDPTDPYGPYYLGLVGSPLAPAVLRKARAEWQNAGKISPLPDRDVLLDLEIRAQAAMFAATHNTSVPTLAPGDLVHDVTPHGDALVLDVTDAKGDNYLVRIIRNAGINTPTASDYLAVEQHDDDAKSSVSTRASVGTSRSKSQNR